MPPLVSVVIPTHTGGHYVREAVRSVMAQSMADWEIKVVCDGCDDGLGELADDPRIEVIHQARSGVSAARNAGFAASTGDFVTFLDHDDTMLPEKLEAQLKVFDANPQTGLCHTQFVQVEDDGTLIAPGHGAPIQYPDLLRCRFNMVISTAMVPRRVVEAAGGFDAKRTQAEDIDFALRVARNHRLEFLPDVHLRYRRHDQNCSGDPWLQYREVDSLLVQHRRYLNQIGDSACAGMIDEGRANNRRYNAEIAMERARRGRPGLRSALTERSADIGRALLISPDVVATHARAFVAARRRAL